MEKRLNIKIKLILVCWEYLIERFGKVLNLHHCYSIFLLINIFRLMKYINEETNFAFVSIKLNFNIAALLSIIYGVCEGGGVLLKHTMLSQD